VARPLPLPPAAEAQERRMPVRPVILLLVLTLAACGEDVFKGQRGPPGPAGPAGPAGAPGAEGTAIRLVDGECMSPCTVACEDSERILSTYAIQPGGTFTFQSDSRATFRPQQPGVASKVVLACIPR
jgi:hypothetical protein